MIIKKKYKELCLSPSFLLLYSFIFLLNCQSKKGETKANKENKVAITTSMFSQQSIGFLPKEAPQISNLEVCDIDGDSLLDVIVCDIKHNTVSIIKQFPKDTYTETIIANNIIAPSHVSVYDFDKDGDQDLLVAALGMLFPNNDKIGSVIVLENIGENQFKKHIILENIPRVADVRAGDIDNDGDIDLATAQFGYDDGETSWIENLGNWKFKNHTLQNISGAINIELVDIDEDKDLDIVSLVSQEWEEIYCFINDGHRQFTPKLLWGSSNEDYGSSGISISDINKDGKPDILYTNGDAFDYVPPLPRPWHGVQWLENKGELNFKHHRICNFPGAFSARVADIDKDNDNDIFAVSGFNYWNKPKAESLIWLENKNNTFIKHTIATHPTHLITLELGDFNNDGLTDLVTGGVYVYPPFKNTARVTLWLNKGE